MRPRGLRAHVRTLLSEPTLLREACRMALAVRRRRCVFPSSSYLRWRAETAYGSPSAEAPTDDLAGFLRWRRRMRVVGSWAR